MAATRPPAAGLIAALVSAAVFATSGSFASALLTAGWSPGAAVTVRITGAAVVLAVPALLMLRGRWWLLRRFRSLIAVYGLVAIAGCQLCYFNAVQYISPGIALLLEYLAPVMVVGLIWLRTRVRPGALTLAGCGAAIMGLLLVIDVFAGVTLHPVGILWGLGAAVCLVVFFLLSARPYEELPPLVMATASMMVAAAVLIACSVAGVLPARFAFTDVTLAGARVSWLVPVIGVILISTAAAYITGIIATRALGPTMASFIGLTEVMFSILFAWWLVGSRPVGIQLAGGALIIIGLVLVRWQEARSAASNRRTPVTDVDLADPTTGTLPVAR
ncbi:membrane protein [Tersicoccus solisilvae]|uniref:Membrane protein n=1 Tax=Tersicoccus solisilvae TaxID=1882339 RepID=A0ABQ1NKU3_9MICC|nr:DMT family transporter [Tersicoccus solisilvae]GGC79690.1 membrane protein [Tersicoccus solisilvae]